MTDSRPPSRRAIAVSGYYGCGNAGDEAVLSGIQAAFARRGAGDRLLALSQNPEATTAAHDMRAVYRMRARTVRETLKECGLLLSGGGSLLQDTTSVRSLLYYLWVCREAQAAGIPYMFYAQGIGPLNRAISRILVCRVANRAGAITVRDPESVALLQKIGVRRVPVQITADPAFALSPAPPEEIDRILQSEGVSAERPFIAVSLRRWGGAGTDVIPAYAELVRKIAANTGCGIVFVPMQAPSDTEISNEVLQAAKLSSPITTLRGIYSPEALLGLLQRAQAVVGMRLHALIFAARVATPLFALSYDPKVDSLMARLEMRERMAPWQGFDPDSIAAQVETLVRERSDCSRRLSLIATEMERLAVQNADIALGLR
jgi:polysaccharide pyruvyl transferase CsaB